jgi:hypothetical protein
MPSTLVHVFSLLEARFMRNQLSLSQRFHEFYFAALTRHFQISVSFTSSLGLVSFHRKAKSLHVWTPFREEVIIGSPIIFIELQVKMNLQAFFLGKSVSGRTRKLVWLLCKEVRQSASYLQVFVFVLRVRLCGD